MSVCRRFAAKITGKPLETEIRIGAVSYLNTLPLLHGFRNHRIMDRAILTTDYPARVAEALMQGTIDIGLVPVAVIPRLRDPRIISDFCIGCNGPVASVAIFGDRPIGELRTIWMDYQSRTSAALARILLRDHWGLSPEICDANDEGYLDRIGGDVGALVIGDRALRQTGRTAYAYDLGQAWKDFTGLPFVFATWVANKPIDPDFIRDFNDANALGLEDLEAVVRGQPDPPCDLARYYTENIRYRFDDEKREGLRRFLALLPGR
jgi:chorismate dehydratase